MGFIESLNKVSNFVKTVLHEVLGEDETVKSLLEVVDNVEEHQEYLWKYVDYGVRTPVFRNMQWIWYGPEFRVGKEEKTSRQIERPLLEVNTHLLKEYFQTWFTLLDLLKAREKELESTLKQLAEEIGVKYDEGALGELRGGISAELKACYVLVDHGKPFLPFSIMQAPIVPSVIRLTASGDIYLFEENLVVDVKSGQLKDIGSIGKLPTYYYSKKRNLSKDLGSCSDLHRLYGIRKGIGVVAEDEKEEAIHFAIYVPWRRWRVSGPLLYLKSTKLPFLVYVHRKNFELYRGEVQNNVLSVELSALLLSEKSSWTDSSKWGLEVYNPKRGEMVKPSIGQSEILFEQSSERLYSVKIKTSIAAEDCIEYQGERYLALSLVYENGLLRVPVFVAMKRS